MTALGDENFARAFANGAPTRWEASLAISVGSPLRKLSGTFPGLPAAGK
jgi:hypothetical protein